ncbi:hypothetical protein F4778DRAFT_794235 [Xylariomycetidae sp. FL2044]|nr:hypothetical protein F4778DRAFT_794235 [Xylariomycetidae sp. FL2044]
MGSRLGRKFKDLVRRDIWARDNPSHTVDWTKDEVWHRIRDEGFYHRSDEVMVSCGTVTIDKPQSQEPDSQEPRVLVVYNNRIGIHQLPKGRKNVGEEHLAAALRETREEAGVAVESLTLRFGTRSTVPDTAQTEDQKLKQGAGEDTGIVDTLNNESIGISECDWSMENQYVMLKIYSSFGVATQEALLSIAEDRLKYTTVWLSEKEASSKLRLEDEKFMVKIAFAYIGNMSLDDWKNAGG